jgi:hypothetical protein
MSPKSLFQACLWFPCSAWEPNWGTLQRPEPQSGSHYIPTQNVGTMKKIAFFFGETGQMGKQGLNKLRRHEI